MSARVSKNLDVFEKVSALVVAAGVLVSAVLFIGAVNDKSNANAERLDRQKEKLEKIEGQQDSQYHEIHSLLIDIRERVTRLEQYQKDHE